MSFSWYRVAAALEYYIASEDTTVASTLRGINQNDMMVLINGEVDKA